MIHTIPSQSGNGFLLRKGQHLTVIDPLGEQVADLFCFSYESPSDSLSSGKSIDYNDVLHFTTGHFLYSQTGKVMLEIVHDDVKVHDFLIAPCSQQMFEMISGKSHAHPSCLENLEKAFSEFPVNKHQIGTTFNIFMNVQKFAETWKIMVQPPLSKPGDRIVFKAHMDLYVGLTACSDEGTNNGSCKPISFQIH